MHNRSKKNRSNSRLGEAARIARMLSAAAPNRNSSLLARILRFVRSFTIAGYYKIVPDIYMNIVARNAKQLESFAAMLQKDANYFNERTGRNFVHEKILELREVDLDKLTDEKFQEMKWENVRSAGVEWSKGMFEVMIFKDLISICNSNPHLLHQVDYNSYTPLALLFATTFTREIEGKVDKKVKVLVANPESKFRVALELIKCGAYIQDVVNMPEAREFLYAISGKVNIMKHASWYNKDYHSLIYIITSLARGAQFKGCLQAGITQQFFTSCLLTKYSRWAYVAPIYRRLSSAQDYLPQDVQAALDTAEFFFKKEMEALHDAWIAYNTTHRTTNFDKHWFWFRVRYGSGYLTPQDFAFSLLRHKNAMQSSSFSAESLLFLVHYFYISKKFSSDDKSNVESLHQRFMVDRLKQIKKKQKEEKRGEKPFESGGYDLIRQTIASRDILIDALIEDGSYDFKASNSDMKLEGGLIELAQENEISTQIVGLLRRELQPAKHHAELTGHIIIKNLEAIENLKSISDQFEVLSRYNPTLHVKKLCDFHENLKKLVDKIESALSEINANSAAREAIENYKPEMLSKCDKLSKDAILLKKDLDGDEEKPSYLTRLSSFHSALSIENLISMTKGVFRIVGKEPQRVKESAYVIQDVLNNMYAVREYVADIFKRGITLGELGKIYALRFASVLEEMVALLEQKDLVKVSSDIEQTITKLKNLSDTFIDAKGACKSGQERLAAMIESDRNVKGVQELSEEVEILIEEVIKAANLRITEVREESIAKLDSKLDGVREKFFNSLVDESVNGVADIELVAKEKKKNLFLELSKKIKDIEVLGYKAMYPELKEETGYLPEVFQEIEGRVQMISYAINVLRGSNPGAIPLLHNDHKNKLINYRVKQCADDLGYALVEFEKGKTQRDRVIKELVDNETKDAKLEEALSLIQEISNIASKAMRVTAANREKASYYLDLLRYSKAKELQDIRRKFGNRDPRLNHIIKFLNEAKQLSEKRIPQLGVADEDGELMEHANAEIKAIDTLKLEAYIANNLTDLARNVKLMGSAARELVKDFISAEATLGAEDSEMKTKEAEAIITQCKKEMIELNKNILDVIEKFTKYPDFYHPIDVINSIQEFLFNALENVVETQNYAVKGASERMMMLKQGVVNSTNQNSKAVVNSDASYVSLKEKAEETHTKVDELKLVLAKFAASKEPPIQDVEEEQLPEELQTSGNEQLHKKEGKAYKEKEFNEHFLMEIKYHGELKGVEDRMQEDFENQPIGILINTLEDAQEKRRDLRESLNKLIETSIKVKELNGSESDAAKETAETTYRDRVKAFGRSFSSTSEKLKNMERKFQKLFELQGITTETSGMMVDIKDLKDKIKNLKVIYVALKKIYKDNKASISRIDKNIDNAEKLEQKLLNAGMVGKKFKDVAYGNSDVIDDFGAIVEIESIGKVVTDLAKDIFHYINLGDDSITKAYEVIEEINALISEKSSILDCLLLSLGVAPKDDEDPSKNTKTTKSAKSIAMPQTIKLVEVAEDEDPSKNAKSTAAPQAIKLVDVVEDDPEMKRLVLFVNNLSLQQMKSTNGQSYLQTSWLSFATNPQNGIGQPLLIALTLKFNQKFESKEQLMEVVRSAAQDSKQQRSL